MTDRKTEYFSTLQEMFPYTDSQVINAIISLVTEDAVNTPQENIYDRLIDLLIQTEENSNEHFHSISENQIEIWYSKLLTIFPDACPKFLRCYLQSKPEYINFDKVLDDISHMAYPKREPDPKFVLKILKETLPNADPSYLEKEANFLAYQSEQELKKFVNDALENENYPKMDEYKKEQEIRHQKERYTTNFSPKAFLKEFPDPEEHFGNLTRDNPHVIVSEENASAVSEEDIKIINEENYALTFLLNHYVYHKEKDIKRVFNCKNKNLYLTCQRLDIVPKALKKPRKKVPVGDIPDNIPLLQEIAFLKNRKLLLSLIKNINDKYQHNRKEAIENDLLQTCECCFDDELIPNECYFCNDGCIFCKTCIKKGVETFIGDGKLFFPCLRNCGSEFGLSTLQMVLHPQVFSKMFQRRQLEEIKKANIGGLEMCPFCEFATIPAENDKTFRCENPDCLKESCRNCRHESHIPLACNEIEFDEDVKLRTFIENKMTEALLRECWKCGKKFIKESGCNKMTCSCGAKMCYICKQPIEDYKHFSNNPGRCPLYTKDLVKFHENIVAKGGLQAKQELGLDKEPNKLKKDPMNNQGLKN